MEVLVTVLYIIACVLLFALAILIHEFGHFIVALKLGLRVEAFSIGFGPAIWKKKINGVEYRISSIPLGGYVSIPDVDPEGTKALEGGKVEEWKSGKVKGKGGKVEEWKSGKVKGKGGKVEEWKSGKVKGEVEGEGGGVKERIPAWKEILVAVAGPLMNVVLAVALAFLLAAIPSAKFGELPSVIGDVLKGGAAEKAGILPGDKVVAIGGRAISTWTEMQTEVQIAGGKAVEFKVERKGKAEGEGMRQVVLSVTPEKNEISGAYYIKALSITNESGAVAWMPNRNPLKQLAWDAGSIFRVLKGLVSPKEAKATAGALGGPVMIAEGIYASMRRSPWDGLGFLRFLNVNLAILNLLPIPVLDGGLILFSFIALVFRRRLPDTVVKYVSMTFMYILIGLMGILIIKDSWRSFKLHTYKPEAEETAVTNRQDSAAGEVPAKPETEKK